ncbi:unnamed protein product [Mytilus coruscus]|uniref:Uncharacterized protein n=1 Tax=Mytilus coruscus TaxID=42192 RepID=A0A6J8BR37_MYTCO|nr:unnamed protein product [Mytilus coruscus]
MHSEHLVQKLGRDSFVLMLASVGEYRDDLKESLSFLTGTILTWIQVNKTNDSKASSVDSLRNTVQVLSEQLKDIKTITSSSLTSSMTEIRKRIITVERNAKTNETNIQKSYAKIVMEIHSDDFLCSNRGEPNTKKRVSEVLQKSPKINEPEVEPTFNER